MAFFYEWRSTTVLRLRCVLHTAASSHPLHTKTESKRATFRDPSLSDDVTSQAVLGPAPSVSTVTGFTSSTTVLNWRGEQGSRVSGDAPWH